jgi:hypothetical protein
MRPRRRSKSAKPGQTAALTAQALLGTLPPNRPAELRKVRAVIRKHLPAGYQEVVRNRLIVYEVPRKRHPETHNGQPL